MKTLIWLMGKPGSGKTTVGQLLQSKFLNSKHFSFGELLKQIQQIPPEEGYTLGDRQMAIDFLKEKSKEVDVLIVDANPYPPTNFDRRKQVDQLFDVVFNINLECSDELAISRLDSRDRELLAHEGKTSVDRIINFNNIVLPEIIKTKEVFDVFDVSTESSNLEEIMNTIYGYVKA